MKNRFVIFDLDGTLFDSMGFWDGVGKEFLRRYGVGEFPSDFGDKVKSMSIDQASNYFRDTFNVRASVREISDSMKDIVAKRYRTLDDFKPNVRDTLDTLKGEGAKLCIATATYKSLIEEALERLKASSYFDFILTCNDVGAGKDNPKIYYEAMDRLGGDKNNTVIVEDSLHAIKTAKRERFKVLAVEDSYQKGSEKEILRLADSYLEVMDAKTILGL